MKFNVLNAWNGHRLNYGHNRLFFVMTVMTITKQLDAQTVVRILTMYGENHLEQGILMTNETTQRLDYDEQ